MLARQAPVVRGDGVFADELAQVPSHAFGEAARVHEDQRRSVRLDQGGEPGVDLLPDFQRHHGLQRRPGQLHRQVHLALVPDVDDSTCRR